MDCNCVTCDTGSNVWPEIFVLCKRARANSWFLWYVVLNVCELSIEQEKKKITTTATTMRTNVRVSVEVIYCNVTSDSAHAHAQHIQIMYTIHRMCALHSFVSGVTNKRIFDICDKTSMAACLFLLLPFLVVVVVAASFRWKCGILCYTDCFSLHETSSFSF